MIDLGIVKPGSTIRIPFSTYDKDDASQITMTNFAAADILIYKDGSTTERASTSGFTATTDFDGKTGKHLAIIDLADNTTAGFYSAGSEYLVAVDSVTVDAITTGGWVARFRIGYDAAYLNTTIATLASQTSFTLTNGPAEDDALNGSMVIIHDVASQVQHGRAVVLDYTGSTKTVTLTAGVTFTAAATDNISFFMPANAAYFASLATVALPLTPTIAGRALDVASGGEAGIDFTNVLLADGAIPALGWSESGTLQSATASTAVLRAATSIADDLILGSTIYIRSGTGAGQSRYIYDWVSSSDTASVSPDWTTTPDNTSVYAILATAPGPTHSSTVPSVNVLQISGDATAADNCRGISDGTGYAGTNNVIPTVTTVNGLAANVITAASMAADASAEITTAVLGTAMTEAYPTDGSTMTVAQALYLIAQTIGEFSISGTTITVKKLDGSTTAATYTLDSSTTPTSRTRAS